MASAAVVGPPPGLGPARSSPSSGHSSEGATGPSNSRAKYSRSFLLKLSGSPLVAKPEMPPFQQWFGDWESYTPRQGHMNQFQHRGDSDQQQSRYNHRGGAGGGDREPGVHGRHYNRMQHDDASGPMGEFSHTKGGDYQSQGHGSGREGYLPGFQGVRRREGMPTGDRAERGGDRADRQDKGDRGGYNKRHEEWEASGEGHSSRFGNDPRGVNSRFSLSGKNPFGQVSASGTFRPAGKDGDGRFPMGRMSAHNRERDNVAFDEAGKPIRIPRSAGPGKDFGNARDHRRPQGEDGGINSRSAGGADEDDGEWETVVPRSPDAERKMARAGALADAASDWRKGPAASGLPKRVANGLGGKANLGSRGGRGDEGRRLPAGGSASFPAWMAEETDSPSWMDDSPATTSASGEKKERGKLNFDAFKGSEIHATPLEGEDSIQAFKREMKERERRAREKEGGEGTGADVSVASASRPSAPPGLTKPSEAPQPSSHGKSEEKSDIKTEAADGRPQSAVPAGSGPPPGLSSNAQTAPSVTSPSSTTSTPAADNAAAAAGGRGSSRFARFFDGAAATNKAKEAQERALAALAQNAHTANSPALSTSSPSGGGENAAGRGGIEALFQNMAVNPHAEGGDGSKGAARGGRSDANPTDADVEGMHKIMALLRGGSGNGKSDGSQTPANQSTARGESSDGVSSAAAAGLIAMLSGAAQPSPSSSTPTHGSQQQQVQSSPQQQRHLVQQVQALPPGLDPTRFNAHAHPPPGITGRASPAPPMGIPPRAQSPNMSFAAGSAQQQQHRPQSPGVGFFDGHQQGGGHHQRVGSHPGGMPQFGAPPGFTGNGGGLAQSPGATGRPPFDPRLLARPPPGLQGPPPPGMNGGNHPAMRGGGNGTDVPGGINPNMGNLLAGLPPHIQHQLMGLPPHVQHSILSGGGPGSQGMPPGMGPPRGMPPGPPGPPMGHSPYFHQQMLYGPGPPGGAGSPQHLGPYGASGVGNGGNSPVPQQRMPHPPPPPPGMMGGMPYYGGGGGGGGPQR